MIGMGIVWLSAEDVGRYQRAEKAGDPFGNFSFVLLQRAVGKTKFESSFLGHVERVKSAVPFKMSDLDDVLRARPGCSGVPAAGSVGGQSYGSGPPLSRHLGQEEATTDGLVIWM